MDFKGDKNVKIEDYWNIYYCGLCDVNFAVSKETDMGLSSCPKCESGEEVVLVELGEVQNIKESEKEWTDKDWLQFYDDVVKYRKDKI